MNREEELRTIPMRKANQNAWPPGVRTIGNDELDALGVDAEGTLFWHGKPVEIRRPVELSKWQSILAGAAAVSAVVIAALEVLKFFGLTWLTQGANLVP